jgi:hypothetical protein
MLISGVACRPDSVRLGYQFEEGDTHTYRMTAHATAVWDVAGGGRGSYEVSFDVTESIKEVDPTGALVVVEMVPVASASKEQGLPSPGLERRSFSLRLDPDGSVAEILQLDGIEASVLDHDELAFIGTYRPPLPEDVVRLGDEWGDTGAIRLGPNVQQIQTRGTLTGFERSDGMDLALIEFSGSSPVEWLTTLPQGEAQLTGEAATRGAARIDLASGGLDEATSSTGGDFLVRVIPGNGDAPITGTLRLDLDLEVTRTS